MMEMNSHVSRPRALIADSSVMEMTATERKQVCTISFHSSLFITVPGPLPIWLLPAKALELICVKGSLLLLHTYRSWQSYGTEKDKMKRPSILWGDRISAVLWPWSCLPSLNPFVDRTRIQFRDGAQWHLVLTIFVATKPNLISVLVSEFRYPLEILLFQEV